MRRHILRAILTFFLLVPLLPGTVFAANTVSSGTCGDNLTWTLYDDGKMVIDGMGSMVDYSSSKYIPWVKLRSTIKSLEVKSGVTSIGRNAFYNSDNLISVSLPDTLTSIAIHAFSYCDKLPRITLPDSVTFIGGSAFSHCYCLESITLPGNVETLGSSVFDGCLALSAIHVDANNPHYSSIDGVLFNKEQTDLLVYPNSKGSVYHIPEHVTAIANNAFFGCIDLTSITLPEKLTSIGSYSFSNCTKLTSVVFPDSIEQIGEHAFDGCELLTNISFLGTPTSIGDYAFGYCYKLSQIAFYGGAPDIAKYAFRYAKATATYPADDPTWTQETFQKYGAGKLTWTPYSCQENGHPFSEEDPATEPACERTGLTAGSHCGFCGDAIVPQEVIPATGHTYDDPIFLWADDLSSAAATLTCHCEAETTSECQLVWDNSQPGTLTVTAICTEEEDFFLQRKKITTVIDDGVVHITLPQTISGLNIWAASYNEAGQLISCRPAEQFKEEPLTFRAACFSNDVKLFFLNEETAPLFPVLLF